MKDAGKEDEQDGKVVKDVDKGTGDDAKEGCWEG